jgi:hypothetical protein
VGCVNLGKKANLNMGMDFRPFLIDPPSLATLTGEVTGLEVRERGEGDIGRSSEER